MKHSLILSLLISFCIICNGQKPKPCPFPDTSYFDGCNTVTWKNCSCMTTLLNCETISGFSDGDIRDEEYVPDSLTSQRHITDSSGQTYLIEYRYLDNITLPNADYESKGKHAHYIAICSITWYKGNKQKIIAKNIKAIYSPVSCASDCDKLWLERLKRYLK